jgi:hypothetical protein
MDPPLRKELAEFWREYDRRSSALRKVLLSLVYRRLASLPDMWLDCWIAEKHRVDLAETQDFSVRTPCLGTVEDRITYCLQDCARATWAGNSAKGTKRRDIGAASGRGLVGSADIKAFGTDLPPVVGRPAQHTKYGMSVDNVLNF